MIRFQCASCQQPIEIDDEWALKAVACPYCKKTVTAPAASTIDQDDEIPVAGPMPSIAPAPAREDPSALYPDTRAVNPRDLPEYRRESDGNPIAIVALALMLSAAACLLVVVVIAGQHPAELASLTQRVEEVGATKAMMAFFEEHGGPPTWMIGFSLAQMGCLMLSVAALVCGLWGLKRRSRRTPAAIAVAVSGGLLLLACSGLVL